MKPLVGLTSGEEVVKGTTLNKINYTYVRALEASGAIPVIIPNLKNIEDSRDIINRLDGIVFTGGADISPLLFDEEPHPTTMDISHNRDKMEIELLKYAYEKKLPILGICRGLQIINAYLGGSLYQDIPSQVENANGHISTLDLTQGYHTVNLVEGTRTYDIFKENKIAVNSQHHQSIKKIGRNLKVNCKSPDGVIEGVETTEEDRFLLALQFHPEVMVGDGKFLKIFSYFVNECKA